MEVAPDAEGAFLLAEVRAMAQGHKLGPFEPAETALGGYRARCTQCRQSVWVGKTGLFLYMLAESCPNRPDK